MPRTRAATVRLGAALAAAALIVTLAGCGSDDNAGEEPGPAATTAEPDSTDGAAPSDTTGVTTGESTTGIPPPTASSTTAANRDATPALAQVRVQLNQLARFDEPVAITTRPGDSRAGRIYVVERAGLVRGMDPDGDVDPAPVLDVSSRTRAGGEQGLLGMAFSADGDELYVNYTDLDGNTNVDAFTMTAQGTADPSSRRQLLFVEQPYGNHNGGHLEVGPDGFLYVGMGDGGSGGDPQGNGQNLATLLGAMLRIDPRPDGSRPYTVPPDNPFVGRAGARGEIWSYGLRNPWGFSFDQATGDLWIGDVGQDNVEEIDVSRASDGAGSGVNFGWNAFEGTAVYDRSVSAPGAVAPIYEYDHGGGDDEGCSVTGGVVYRGSAIANLAGAYLFADYCVAGIRAMPAQGGDARLLLDEPGAVAGFGFDAQGEVLIASLNGAVYRLEAR